MSDDTTRHSHPGDSETTRAQRLIGGDYTLHSIIGHGGMSTVWLGYTTSGQACAIKVLRPEFSDNTEFCDRFRNEATASTRIISPHVVRTYDYRETTDDRGRAFLFIVMEYVPGHSLADILARTGPLPEHQTLDVLTQAAGGLAVIHAHGMVHRDMKPGNILITDDGRVKITDFGIAKAAAAVPLTRTGMVVGTAQYVSPEQAQGLDVTAASDIYSLGVVGYEMLAGKRPFGGDSSVSVAIAHISTPPPQLPQTISPNTRELIGFALRKDPLRRYADGTMFQHAIDAVRAGHRAPAPVDRSATYSGGVPAASTPAPAGAGRYPAGPVAAQPAADTAVQVKRRSSAPLWIIGGALVVALGVIAGGVATLLRTTSDTSDDTPRPVVTRHVVTTVVTTPSAQPTPSLIDIAPDRGSDIDTDRRGDTDRRRRDDDDRRDDQSRSDDSRRNDSPQPGGNRGGDGDRGDTDRDSGGAPAGDDQRGKTHQGSTATVAPTFVPQPTPLPAVPLPTQSPTSQQSTPKMTTPQQDATKATTTSSSVTTRRSTARSSTPATTAAPDRSTTRARTTATQSAARVGHTPATATPVGESNTMAASREPHASVAGAPTGQRHDPHTQRTVTK